MIKERPILFSAPMVRAILEGRKTQTRRAGKIQAAGWQEIGCSSIGHATKGTVIHATYRAFPGRGTARWAICEFPFGMPGDRLWVREVHFAFGHWEVIDGAKTKTGRTKWRFVQTADEILFDPPAEFRKGRHHKDPGTSAWHQRLARFMPRKLSRISLEITKVRAERLQDISHADAVAEGMAIDDAVYDYSRLWDSINGEGEWDANPWVWVIEFKKVEIGGGK